MESTVKIAGFTQSSRVDDSPRIRMISLLSKEKTCFVVVAVVLFTTIWCMYCLGNSKLQATAILIAVPSLSPVRIHILSPLQKPISQVKREVMPYYLNITHQLIALCTQEPHPVAYLQ